MFINLLCLPVLAEQAPQNAHTTHPENLGGEPSLPGTPALTCVVFGLTYNFRISKNVEASDTYVPET